MLRPSCCERLDLASVGCLHVHKPARPLRQPSEVTSLQQLVERLEKAGDCERVDVECMMEAVGRSSFCALLLLG